ncbi:MAG: hypothetical protein ABSB96_11515 [Gaiellaceae bacterium]
MSLLVSELPEVADPYSVSQAVIALRLVDAATRLHAWSIPMPCCIHGNPLDQRCDGCDDAAPLDPFSDLI